MKRFWILDFGFWIPGALAAGCSVFLVTASVRGAEPVKGKATPTPTPVQRKLSGGFGSNRAVAAPAAASQRPAAGQSPKDAVRAASGAKGNKGEKVRVTITNDTLITDPKKGKLTTSSVRIPSPAAATAASIPTATMAADGEKVDVGEATFDQPDFKYSYYVDGMLARIGANWFKPAESSIPPMIRFRIEHDGTISDPQVERSSHLPFVDNAALRAVKASSPLQPLPREFRGRSLGVHLIFK